MKMSEYFSMLLEKNLVSNSLSYRVYYETYIQHCKTDDSLELNEFMYIIYLLSKKVFKHEKKPIKALINELLTEKVFGKKGVAEKAKAPNVDENLRRLLERAPMGVMLSFEKDLQQAFTYYALENVNAGKIMLFWREIELQNHHIPASCVLLFLREAEILPSKISVELVQDFLVRITPPTNGRESAFFMNNILREIYENGEDKKTPLVAREYEPRLHFYEFQLLIGRIAQEVVVHDKNSSPEMKKTDKKLAHFLSNVLFIRTNDQLEKGEGLPDLGRAFHRNLKKAWAVQEALASGEGAKQVGPSIQKSVHESQNEEDPFFELLNSSEPVVNMPDIIKALDKDLPELPFRNKPAKTVPEKNPTPVVIGMPPPVGKERARAKAKPPARRSKEAPIRWANQPPDKAITSAQLLASYKNLMQNEEDPEKLDFPIDLSKIRPQPVIVKECLYTDVFPRGVGVEDQLEAAFEYQNEGNFVLSLTALSSARQKWENNGTLETKDQLFFEFMTGMIFESADRNDYALKAYLNCLTLSEKLSFSDPDRGLAYSGLGSVFYSMFMYDIACRAFLKSKSFRETSLGDEHPDCASVFNNIGCCYYMMEQYREAMAYFRYAEAIFETFLGPSHERTMMAKNNLGLVNKKPTLEAPPFGQLWLNYYSPFPDPPPKRK